ncbi:Pkinase-domain-containing protein, partial [Microthyrium microscopicum]
MKAPTQPGLTKRANVIQTVAKPPIKPSVFQSLETKFEDKPRRTEYPSRGKVLPPPRLGNSRHDDYGSHKYPPPREPHRFDREPYRERPLHPTPLGPRDRRPFDNRDVDPRARRGYEPPPKILKSSKPRRKKFKKVVKKHRRVVLPVQKLPEDWAQSDFVYYPKPDRNSVVGAGTYGKVFKAHHVYLSKCVALKTLPLRQDRWVKDGLHLTSLREIKLLKSISHQHENIIGIREIFLEGPSCNLVFDYFEFDMHGIIYSSKVGLEDGMMKDLIQQVFRGLDFLHTKAHILHRDIKAANILVSSAGQVRITDFGLAKHVKDDAELENQPWYRKKFEHSNRVITTPYRPPELLLGATLYGGEVDVWSAGCVLFEAFLKKLPFQGTGEDVDHLLTIWKILGLPNVNKYPEVVELEWYWLFMSRVQPKKSIFARLYKNKISPQLYHLLCCIFQHDPKKRPTAAQVLTHPFFTSESPLPESSAPVLQSVEGEWHELEYKMIRDKEKASVRRKQ